ncbi:hypothetical protein G7067_06625 [Leucobacter insecticola]|uniref:Uncharacterized protein n=1 Tax=Leucobacter insecticola TaxID=2714934 RepID=A0A6G8FIH0_9MICO|nr:hypothetical protein [Leucobacter insecticola]QIM16167.1 hypothetical protein G7067_06625 [Leucobacter insecticola]
MTRRPILLVLVLQLALVVATPTFWMIDILQAEAYTQVFSEPIEDGNAPVSDDDPEPQNALIAPTHSLASALGFSASEVCLPLVTTDRVARFARCLLPPAPFLEVPTSPPLAVV